MQGAGQHEPDTRQALLRALRGTRRQRDIAAKAGVSLSLYQRLETGRFGTVRMWRLMRVARALGAKSGERVELIRLVRPDLVRNLASMDLQKSALDSLYVLGSAMLRAKHGHELVEIAVELLYAALGPGYTAFAFERRAARSYSLSACMPAGASIGSDIGAVANRKVRRMYAAVRSDRRVVAVLGVADLRRLGGQRRVKTVLNAVAEILELTLQRIPSKSNLN